MTTTPPITLSVTVSAPTFAQYLTIGGVIATGWQTTYDTLGKNLRDGIVALQNKHDEAARLLANNYRWLADRVVDWSSKVDSANGPLATAFADKLRADLELTGACMRKRTSKRMRSQIHMPVHTHHE
jgi:hypothetical protein